LVNPPDFRDKPPRTALPSASTMSIDVKDKGKEKENLNDEPPDMPLEEQLQHEPAPNMDSTTEDFETSATVEGRNSTSLC
jgi:hypothetical protein